MNLRYLKAKSPYILFPLLTFAAGLTAQAQSLTIVSGNGQLISLNGLAQPLVVRLTDSAGKPFPSQQVSFSVSTLFLGVQTATITTDANGLATYPVSSFLSPQSNGIPIATATITAQYGASTVTFTETVLNPTSSGASLLSANYLNPPGQINAQSGVPFAPPLQFQVQAAGVGPIPGVLITASTDNPLVTVVCQEGATALTNSSGVGNCTPIFTKTGSGGPLSANLILNLGGSINLPNLPVTVTNGLPAIIAKLSGDNQTGLSGRALNLPLVAQVTDISGNPLAGISVVFESVTPNGATFTNVRTPSDDNGKVSANVILGTVPGPIQIRVRDAANLVTSPALFTATANIQIAAIQKVQGDNQSAFVSTAFAQPLTVQVNDASNQPVQGATVQFAVVQGSATLGSPSGTTAANGQFSTTVTAGSAVGPITISATTGAFTTNFTLTANPVGPANFQYSGAASGIRDSLSPGSLVTISATGLVSNSIQGIVTSPQVGPLPVQVAGVTVQIGGIFSPIFYVSNVNGTQSVTVQVPWEVAAGSRPITIAVTGGGSTTAQVNVLPVSPGIFEYTGTDNQKRSVALKDNGSVVSPSNPAGRGETIRLYVTGLGPVSPSVSTGGFAPTGTDPKVTNSVIVGVNNAGVAVTGAIYARNLTGVEEISFTIPTDNSVVSGNNVLSVAVQGPNGLVYSNGSTIAVQ